MTYALLGYLLTLIASFVTESRAKPGSARPWRQPPMACLLHALATAQIYTLLLGLTGRIGFSTVVSMGLAALLVFASNAKMGALLEPLVFSDLFLTRQLIRYPRLYFPFVGGGSWWLSALAGLLLLIGFGLDHPQPRHFRLEALISLLLISVAMMPVARMLRLQLRAVSDQARLGFFASFYAGLINGMRPATTRDLESALGRSPFAVEPSKDILDAGPSPDVILIQSESFFDARRLGPEVRPELLQHFDRACRESVCWGDLAVPAFGANTMRSEFAVLSGLPPAAQGYAAYYPYTFVRHTVPSLAGWYRQQGYLTSFIHPYHADFFGRDRVMPCLQFQQFIDIKNFGSEDYQGPYVGDRAVAGRIIEQLQAAEQSGQPCFVMAVTMENHGPLHLEQVSPHESTRYHAFGDGSRLNDLTAYLRHLEHADQMIGQLLDYLTRRSRPAVVCFYGDHVPALPDLFADLGKPQSVTDYFIWHSAARPESTHSKLNADGLGQRLIQVSAPGSCLLSSPTP
ncbi:LTA synthase family protein [Frateuria aurantia]